MAGLKWASDKFPVGKFRKTRNGYRVTLDGAGNFADITKNEGPDLVYRGPGYCVRLRKEMGETIRYAGTWRKLGDAKVEAISLVGKV